MPTEGAHVAKAAHNIRFVCFIEPEGLYHDWAVTAAFYVAVHVAEAVFASLRTEFPHSSSREGREHVLKREKRLTKIWRHYRPIQSAATIARYLGAQDTFDAYATPDEVKAKLLQHHLVSLLKSASKFVSAESRKALGDGIKALKKL